MAQSLFKAIKQLQPETVIDVLAPDWSRPLLERMPEVRYTHSLPIPHKALQLKKRFDIAQTLKPYRYHQAIVLPNSWKSTLVPWFSKIPERTGWLGEMRWGMLNDARYLDKKVLRLMVERFVMLAYPKGTSLSKIPHAIHPPKLATAPETVEQALLKFGLNALEKPILALCPGAEFGPSKRWPEEYYADIANKKLQEGWSVWLFGSKNDQAVSQKIQTLTQSACVDLTGKTSLGEAIDLLSCSSAVVSNDSGLMHIAAALDKPIVAVYGSTDPGFTPPLHGKAKIARLSSLPCSPCFKRECPLKHHACMHNLSPKSVLETLKSLEVSCEF